MQTLQVIQIGQKVRRETRRDNDMDTWFCIRNVQYFKSHKCRPNLPYQARKVSIPVSVRIPVSSPYFEVRMDTSGSYALVKARTIFPESAHPHDTQVTRTLYTSRTRLTSTVYAPTLRAQFTRNIQDLQAYFTRVKCTPPPTHTINASKLRVQSTRPTYVYNLRLSLALTRYNQCQRIMCTTYAPNLRIQYTS